ncbi:hypothetical protein GN958_ATG05141 [Phytophthora infestans]|uniref:Uncharacterized protein n=1 Tax=Phytophthora infestans TaxID=4787 RepID=A0A8S9UX32_PHYIN|nr:hypothetical protein GN958_ATG05141 [Phytophthora infestans]
MALARVILVCLRATIYGIGSLSISRFRYYGCPGDEVAVVTQAKTDASKAGYITDQCMHTRYKCVNGPTALPYGGCAENAFTSSIIVVFKPTTGSIADAIDNIIEAIERETG